MEIGKRLQSHRAGRPSLLSASAVVVLLALATNCLARDASKSHFVRQSGKDSVVVFVNGVLGDSKSTWTNTSTGAYWPDLMKVDPHFADFDIFVIGYASSFFHSSYALDELVEVMRRDIDDVELFSKYKHVYFLCHSMGGLVVRKYLTRYPKKAHQVPMIYFFSTPTTGSEIAKLATTLSSNHQIQALSPIDANDYLASIQKDWLAAQFSIASYCAYETQDTYGIRLVDMSSATSLCNRPLDPINLNHIDIVKPRDTKDAPYTAFRNAVQEVRQQLDIPSAKGGGTKRRNTDSSAKGTRIVKNDAKSPDATPSDPGSGTPRVAIGSITQGNNSTIQFGDHSLAAALPQSDPTDEVFNHLTASAETPHSNNPFDTKFTIRNGGSKEIGKRQVFSKPILFVTGGNATRYRNIREALPSGGLNLPPGNADTGRCLEVLRIDTPSLPECMDTAVTINFSLKDSPEIFREKSFRFLGMPSNGVFEWSEQSPDSVESYCEQYVRAPATKAIVPCDPSKSSVTACNTDSLDIQDVYVLNGPGVNAQNTGKTTLKGITVINLPEPLNGLYVRGRDLAFACETLKENRPIWPQAKIASPNELKAEIIKWKDQMALTLTEADRSNWVSQFGWYPDPGTDDLEHYCKKMDRDGPMLNFLRAMETRSPS